MSRNPGYALIARVFDRVLPKAPDFFMMLSTQSAKVAETAELLVRFMQTNSPELAAQINADEHTADDIKVANIHILNEAFSTPIDREDIYRAITNLDEIVNYCKDTVNEMAALEVEPDRFTQGMAELLLVGALLGLPLLLPASTPPSGASEAWPACWSQGVAARPASSSSSVV